MHFSDNNGSESIFTCIKNLAKNTSSEEAKGKFVTYAQLSVYGTILIYIISSAALVFRNIATGLPFMTFSIAHAAVIAVYFCIFFGIFLYFDHIICSLKSDWQNKIKEKGFIKALLLAAAIILLLAIIISAVLALLFHNVLLSAIMTITFYAAMPAILRFVKFLAHPALFLITATLVSLLFVWSLPPNLGGLGPQRVLYISQDHAECSIYDYYGTTDSMHVFKHKEIIRLVPSGEGSIFYGENQGIPFNPALAETGPVDKCPVE